MGLLWPSLCSVGAAGRAMVRFTCLNRACPPPPAFKPQSAMRSKLGEDTTAFERITDGARIVCKGDVVRVNAKPQLVGHVMCFTIPQVTSRVRGGRGDACLKRSGIRCTVLVVRATMLLWCRQQAHANAHITASLQHAAACQHAAVVLTHRCCACRL